MWNKEAARVSTLLLRWSTGDMMVRMAGAGVMLLLLYISLLGHACER